LGETIGDARRDGRSGERKLGREFIESFYDAAGIRTI
jgi:hypothetical protein